MKQGSDVAVRTLSVIVNEDFRGLLTFLQE